MDFSKAAFSLSMYPEAETGFGWKKLTKKAKIHVEELIILMRTKDLVFMLETGSNIAIDSVSRRTNRKILPLPAITKAFDLYHKRKTLTFFSKLIQQGDLCFDVGANLGKFTEVLAELGARVVCVEPQEACLQQLQLLFGNNKNVTIVPKALGNHEGEGELMINEEIPGISTMSTEYKNAPELSKYKWTKKKKVPITTLDNLIAIYGLPKYCKIDVEGFEAQVLKGLSNPIEFVSFEFHKWCFEEAEKCVRRLLKIGNVEFNFVLGESMNFALHEWVPPEELYKKIVETSYILDDRFFWGDIYAKFL